MRSISFLLGLIASFSLLADEDWQERKIEDGISVYSRPVVNSRYQEFKAVTEVPATVAEAMSLLNDNDACVHWLHRCEESRVLSQEGNTERYFYQVSGLPFPAKSRDMVFHATIEYRSDKSVLVKMTAVPDYLPDTKHVRIEKGSGTYILEPVSDSTTRVIWQQHVDPAGALPSWIVNSMLTDLPFKSLENFRELVIEPPYRGTVFTYNDEGKPIDLERPDP